MCHVLPKPVNPSAIPTLSIFINTHRRLLDPSVFLVCRLGLSSWFVFLIARSLGRSALSHSIAAPSPRDIYFLPLFLMPWAPVFRGPLLPLALSASSFRAFSSVEQPSATLTM